MTNATPSGKPDAGNPHVRFDEGEVDSYPPTAGRPEGVAMRGAKPRRGSLLYKRLVPLLAILVAAASWTAVAAGTVVWRADFADPAAWAKPAVYGPLKVSRTATSLELVGSNAKEADTAWQVETVRTKVPLRGRYAVCVRVTTHGISRDAFEGTVGYKSAVIWQDASGVEVGRRLLEFVFADGPAFDYRFVADVPPSAATFSVKLGWDTPNLFAQASVRFEDLRLEAVDVNEPLGVHLPDIHGPRIRLTSESPTRKETAPAILSVTDESGVDAESLKVVLDGTPTVVARLSDRADGLTAEIDPPGGRWSEGLHELKVSARDRGGRETALTKVFLIGEAPKTPKVTLRDDGLTLVDGEPFFPIGIYGFCKRDFNAYDWDRGVADLKAAGFNMLHSYGAPRDPELHRCAKKHGMKMWMEAHRVDREIVDAFRHNDNILAWYLGDDTAMNTRPAELWDRADNIRAVDPTRLTVQADVLRGNFGSYAPQTDVFLPEIYPVHGDQEATDRSCVAETIREMKSIREVQARDVTGAPHGVWPIIQQFKGWGCKRFPKEDEFYAMNFAAIIHGAKGLAWYTYGGFVDEKKKRVNYGVTSSEVVWRATTNATRRIAALVPILVMRDPVQPPVPEVLKGPRDDVDGGPSVTALLKEKDGVHWLFAVNSSDAEVTARFSPQAKEPVEVLWEDRTVQPRPDGSFEDVFRPLAVHVYRWKGFHQ